MSLKYINNFYNKKFRRGMKVKYKDNVGVITGSKGAYVRVRMENELFSKIYHPEDIEVYGYDP